jgi:hypothetical protein
MTSLNLNLTDNAMMSALQKQNLYFCREKFRFREEDSTFVLKFATVTPFYRQCYLFHINADGRVEDDKNISYPLRQYFPTIR